MRALTGAAEMRNAVALYREVFRLGSDDPAVSPRLLISLAHNGGSVIGAFDGGDLVGFAYGFPGVDAETGGVYHYSQMAAVRDDQQGRGVGRALKLGQRDHVLSTGVTAMRWAFDPVRTRNAHFNLDVLGAVARWFAPNLLGVEHVGRDAGMRTDRLIVEWDLTAEPVTPSAPPLPDVGWGERLHDGGAELLGLPRDWDAFATADRDGAMALREGVAATLDGLVADGYAAVSCRVADADTAVYRFVRGA
ncbi:MAG TPA: GNAT family N-acetyltransferase [Streptosporangiaceae bacterium]